MTSAQVFKKAFSVADSNPVPLNQTTDCYNLGTFLKS